MKLLQQLKLSEDADVGGDAGIVSANCVAGAPMRLFAKAIAHTKPTKIIKIQKQAKSKGLRLSETFYRLYEFADDLGGEAAGSEGGGQPKAPVSDTTEIIAKLKSLETKEQQDTRNTSTFGLEDEDGGIVRVTIRDEQAEEFEKALQHFLVGDPHDENRVPEIAEILFKLKDQFNIINVEWPDIEEDEEPNQQVEVGVGGDEGAEGVDGISLDADESMPADGGMGTDQTVQATDLLTQVIDVLRADADARKADAKAREAEARNREAEAAASQAMARVKQEEQVLDMETYNRAKKDESKESKRLAQLAKWKHEVRGDDSGNLDDEMSFDTHSNATHHEDEEVRSNRPLQTPKPTKPPGGRVHPHDIAKYILGRVTGNKS